MAQRLVTRAELARLARVSRAAITKACKGQLAAACVDKRVDLDHPAVREYLAGKGVELPARAPTSGVDSTKKRGPTPTAPRPKREKREASPPAHRPRRASPAPLPGSHDDDDELDLAGDADDDIETYAHLTLHELVQRFGTKTGLKDWLDARKKIADIREKDLKNDETVGRLIERELVKTHVFGAIEAGNRRLLRDVPRTIVLRLYALAKSGAPAEEAEKSVREIISSQLRPVKDKAGRVLRNA